MSQAEQSTNNTNEKAHLFIDRHPFLFNVFSSLVASAIFAIIPIIYAFVLLPSRLTEVENQISDIKKNIDNIDFDELNQSVNALSGNKHEINVIDKLEDLEKQILEILEKTDKIDALESRLLALEEGGKTGSKNEYTINGDGGTIVISPTMVITESINEMSRSVEDEKFVPSSLLSSDNRKDDFVIDSRNGDEYTIGQLTDRNISTSYFEGEKEVFFNGQYDENGYWDGDCVINIYENGKLVSVKDVKYKNGEILSYEQAFLNKEKSNWFITKRKHEGEYNSGETWQFISEDSYEQKFDSQDFLVENLIHVKDFESIMNLKLVGYYCGNTADGLYNDDGGDAYLIKFFDNGTVRTLYVGKFSNGEFFDKTGESWYITKAEDTDYMYYKGDFEDEHPANVAEGHFENGITQERINEIIEGKIFTYELEWDITEDL